MIPNLDTKDALIVAAVSVVTIVVTAKAVVAMSAIKSFVKMERQMNADFNQPKF